MVKLQRGNFDTFSREEQRAVSLLSLRNEAEDTETLSFVEHAQKRLKLYHEDLSKRYQHTRFLMTTSSICERLFSKVGHALTGRRASINSGNLESQIVLNLNRDLWGIDDLSDLTQYQHIKVIPLVIYPVNSVEPDHMYS